MRWGLGAFGFLSRVQCRSGREAQATTDMTAQQPSTSPSTYPGRLTRWQHTYFESILSASQLFGIAHVVMAGFFYHKNADGLYWGGKKYGHANYHGFFMTIGLVFFQGEALLSYRLHRHEAKIVSKFIHTAFHALAIAFWITALVAIIQHKNVHDFPHFYSFHSWLGAGIMGIYLVQFIFGVFSFLLPGTPIPARAAFMPLHRLIGAVSFCLSCVQSLIGSVSFSSMIPDQDCYETLSCPDRLDFILNFSLVSLVLYAVSVMILITTPEWKRQKTPDEIK